MEKPNLVRSKQLLLASAVSSSTTMPSAESFPPTVIIIGAGVFGLSTALAIAKRHPSTKVTIVDRLTPPVPDGTSVDTTRCIRSGKSGAKAKSECQLLMFWLDYADPIYAGLAREAQKKIQDDLDLRPYLFQQGMTYVCNGQKSRFTDIWNSTLHRAKSLLDPKDIVELSTREEVYRRIHGGGTHPPSAKELGREPQFNKAYCNMKAAFIDAEKSIQVYYNRCLRKPTITFRCGSAVDHINIVENQSSGVTLEDGSTIAADKVIVAAGAWSNKLVFLGSRLQPIGHEVAWVKVTPEEEVRWKNMSITTNLSTGLNMFPPYLGEVKILRRSPGYTNTVTVPHPEDRSNKIRISYPRTIVSNPTDMIPAKAEAALRDNLREIMPALADRPFDRTKICW